MYVIYFCGGEYVGNLLEKTAAKKFKIYKKY